MHYPEPIARLMDSFMKLPGIGAKTAARLAFFCMDMREEDVLNFANSLISCKRDLHMCSVCGNVTQEDPCEICADTTRDRTKILVVEDSRDVMSMERMKEYKGSIMCFTGYCLRWKGRGRMILILRR